MRTLIGIDDTDNLDSRGTGYRARLLGEVLAEIQVNVLGITRHQLLVDPRIPYTSHNSSACLETVFGPALWANVVARCQEFLPRESAPGSDAGLCLAQGEEVSQELTTFGQRAKLEVLSPVEAKALACTHGLYLEGVTGTGNGVIGALAAVSLRAGGNDGRFLWLPGLRELRGVFTTAQLCAQLRLDIIETEAGQVALPGDRICVGDWPRPLMRAGRIALVVQEADHVEYDWLVAPKARLKQLSE